MKNKFNKSWISSRQPRKQKKFRFNAPNHIKRKFMSAILDKSLIHNHKRKNIEIKKGDEVKVMRGKFKGKMGKVLIVDIKNTRIQIDGIQRSKTGGEKLETWFSPSKVKIISLEDSDERRFKLKKNPSQKEDKIQQKEEKIVQSKTEIKKWEKNKNITKKTKGKNK